MIMTKLYQNIKDKIKENYFLYIILINVKANVFYFLNKIFGYHYTKRKFYKKMGYPLNIKNPQSFNDKLIWKKINDRNPLLPVTADKYQVRSYIKETLGEEKANEILIPLLYVTDKPQKIPFEELPPAFIIKPNHASGRYIIVEEGRYNKEEIINTCRKWLKTPYGLDRLEWAYKSIKRKIVIEKLLREGRTNILKEFNFHMFHGKCKLVNVFFDRMNNKSMSSFDKEWNSIQMKISGIAQGPKIQKPKNYDKMLELAGKLSKPFDHVRMDFYNLDGKIYFGEFTHYTASGIGIFEPSSFAFELGKHWKIEPQYWRKYIN